MYEKRIIAIILLGFIVCGVGCTKRPHMTQPSYGQETENIGSTKPDPWDKRKTIIYDTSGRRWGYIKKDPWDSRKHVIVKGKGW